MVHKARIMRSRVSIEESSRCIDSLLPLPEEAPLEDWYLVMIEKIHNLALTIRLGEALKLTLSMMEKCMSRGSTKVKAWFERYLAVIYFYKGDYLKCLHYYGKSLALPEEEQDWLSRHCVGAYAAKAYQMTGQEEKVLPLMEAELSRLRRLGLYEELSVNFLMYAEVLLAEETRKMDRGEAPDFTSLNRYLGLAEEYAALNRNTKEYSLFAKVLRLGADLLARPEKAAERIDEVLGLARETTPFFQAFVYWRIANALHMLGRDFGLCKEYYLKCIETGEMAGTMNFPTIACGELAAVYLREGDKKRAEEYTRRFMELSLEYGQRYYFRLHGLFGGVLALAMERGITLDFTREVLAYGGYAAKRVYVNTLGSFYIAPAHDRNSPVKIRTQKARELLAYMLEHREGVSRERIYADLWEVSEANVTSLFHTRRGEIRRAFESLGAKNPIRYEKGIYRLDMAEIACDYDDFLQAAEEFRENPAPESAQKVVDRYTGRYLDDMEALWAESTRLCFEKIFLAAAETLMESCLESGEQAKLMELLRRCTGLSCQEYRIDAVKEGKKRKRKQ